MNDPLAVIYNEGYWRVNVVSPMFDLQYNIIKLKQYSTKIRQALVSRVVDSSDLMVSIENLPLLKYSNEDPSALKITVKNKVTEVYVAIFLSWGNGITIDNATTHLPYMLERGGRRIVNMAVKNTVQALFDCIILPINFTQGHLLDFMFNFIENDNSRSTNQFVLTYRTPQVNFKDNITISFEIGDIREIWNRVKESNHDQSRRPFVAYQMILNQICYMYTLEVTLLQLYEVALPTAVVKNSSNMVKMKTPEIVNSVFTILNEITRERFQIE
ncbi:uncharacterized protein [Maniola hyperantus]|uniref:uncharacterized protein n=1 Tax=Aphantopus hyperantus TaxID=2795564 RepID=UPI00156972B1|nr:uncharacterized protein LOC117992070 [Maniola hyperantus]